MGRVLALDGLRALAITAVMTDHFWPGGLSGAIPLGVFGVKLFFVLSGYLITGLLFDGLERLDRGQTTRRQLLASFYIRRAARILPVYYLTLAVAAALELGEVRESLGWHLLYLSNFYVAGLGAWPAATAHFWSLAVEWQFYLSWPLVLLFAPRGSRRAAVVGAVVVALAARFLAVRTGMGTHALYTLPFGSLDALAIGGVLAALRVDRPSGAAWRRRFTWSAVLVAAPLFVVLCIAQRAGVGEELRRLLWPLCVAVVFGALVGWVAAGASLPARRILEWPPFVRLGRSSYGVYLFHPLVAYGLLGAAGVRSVPTALGCAAASIALGEASWRWIERPLLARREPLAPRLRPRIALPAIEHPDESFAVPVPVGRRPAQVAPRRTTEKDGTAATDPLTSPGTLNARWPSGAPVESNELPVGWRTGPSRAREGTGLPLPPMRRSSRGVRSSLPQSAGIVVARSGRRERHRVQLAKTRVTRANFADATGKEEP